MIYKNIIMDLGKKQMESTKTNILQLKEQLKQKQMLAIQNEKKQYNKSIRYTKETKKLFECITNDIFKLYKSKHASLNTVETFIDMLKISFIIYEILESKQIENKTLLDNISKKEDLEKKKYKFNKPHLLAFASKEELNQFNIEKTKCENELNDVNKLIQDDITSLSSDIFQIHEKFKNNNIVLDLIKVLDILNKLNITEYDMNQILIDKYFVDKYDSIINNFNLNDLSITEDENEDENEDADNSNKILTILDKLDFNSDNLISSTKMLYMSNLIYRNNILNKSMDLNNVENINMFNIIKAFIENVGQNTFNLNDINSTLEKLKTTDISSIQSKYKDKKIEITLSNNRVNLNIDLNNFINLYHDMNLVSDLQSVIYNTNRNICTSLLNTNNEYSKFLESINTLVQNENLKELEKLYEDIFLDSNKDKLLRTLKILLQIKNEKLNDVIKITISTDKTSDVKPMKSSNLFVYNKVKDILNNIKLNSLNTLKIFEKVISIIENFEYVNKYKYDTDVFKMLDLVTFNHKEYNDESQEEISNYQEIMQTLDSIV